jgi:hypothetical protein
MIYREIAVTDRQNYFNFISKTLSGQQIELEVVGIDIGDQIEKDWAAVEGLSYDSAQNTLHIHTQPFSHHVTRLEEVIAVEDGIRVRSICIKDEEGNLRIMHFREPLRLEAPLRV